MNQQTQATETAQNGQPNTRRQLSTQQIMTLKEHKYEWQCDTCEHTIPAKLDQIEAVPWFIVRHLMMIHRRTADQVISKEPSLTQEVRTYCADMRIK